MELRPDLLLSALGGSGATALLARYAITKALRDLEKVSERVIAIDKQLAQIAVRLEKLSDHEQSIKELQLRKSR